MLSAYDRWITTPPHEPPLCERCDREIGADVLPCESRPFDGPCQNCCDDAACHECEAA